MIKKLTRSKQLAFRSYLIEAERSNATISKYVHDVSELVEFVCKREISKAIIVEYKSHLIEKYKPSSVNSKLAAVNSFLEFIGRSDCRVKPLKLQKNIFANSGKVLKRTEYEKAVNNALKSGNRRLALILQTICSTGIRVSELQFVTVQTLSQDYFDTYCKGKSRRVYYTKELRKLLLNYCRDKKITAGAVFITKNGNPINRTNIWKMMKKLGKISGVNPEKLFPHNLRHLFAVTYYEKTKDIVRLSGILGHSDINTTKIYTLESGENHIKQLKRLELVFATEYFLCFHTRK